MVLTILSANPSQAVRRGVRAADGNPKMASRRKAGGHKRIYYCARVLVLYFALFFRNSTRNKAEKRANNRGTVFPRFRK